MQFGMETERGIGILTVPTLGQQVNTQTQQALRRRKRTGPAGLDRGVKKQPTRHRPLSAINVQGGGRRIVFRGTEAIGGIEIISRVAPGLDEPAGHRQMEPLAPGVVAQLVHRLLHPIRSAVSRQVRPDETRRRRA
ncbi:hypothetical protein [uncultured Thiodictyon sp.]|uniref:hypothetical protein n=1 Tax=uncultured Thiodictyon sp. TaxID=1846217 RepID=UPI0025EE10F3|nr:hypothetical protein [uncultured Thiodictyon sp.]